MYAVFVESTLDPNRIDEVDAMLRDKIFPMVKAAPDFVSGTWVRSDDDTEGRSVVIFKSKEEAQKAFEAAAQSLPSGGPITIQSSKLLRVVGQI